MCGSVCGAGAEPGGLRWLAACCLIALAMIVGSYETVPTHTTDATHFDTLIVLGCPADPDGKASPEQRERVLEAVREWKAGRTKHMIVTGGSVYNQWSEAATMARVAEAVGVPAGDIIEEGRSRNTIENIFYSDRLMREHGWTSAEVVSSPSHLPRTGLILERYGFGWRTQASEWPREYSWLRIAPYYVHEAAGTAWLRWFGFGANAFLPARR